MENVDFEFQIKVINRCRRFPMGCLRILLALKSLWTLRKISRLYSYSHAFYTGTTIRWCCDIYLKKWTRSSILEMKMKVYILCYGLILKPCSSHDHKCKSDSILHHKQTGPRFVVWDCSKLLLLKFKRAAIYFFLIISGRNSICWLLATSNGLEKYFL